MGPVAVTGSSCELSFPSQLGPLVAPTGSDRVVALWSAGCISSCGCTGVRPSLHVVCKMYGDISNRCCVEWRAEVDGDPSGWRRNMGGAWRS